MIIAYLVIASSLILNTHLSGYNTLFIKVDEEEEEERKKKNDTVLRFMERIPIKRFDSPVHARLVSSSIRLR